MEAVVTVTDERYFAGTQVLFYSFLKHHPNFKGEFVVIHNQLPQYLQIALRKSFPVKFEQVSQELLFKLTELSLSCQQFSNKLTRFWSIELFRLKQYSKILFLDSDILCKGNLGNLMKLEDQFVAVADLSHYKGRFRDRSTFEFSALVNATSVFQRTFNAGVMLVNQRNNQENNYEQLLNGLSAEKLKQVSSGHTDQYLLNTYFEDKVTYVGANYNYILREEDFILEKEGVSTKDAKVWHYIRNPKPWNFKRLLKNKLKGKENPLHILEWQREYQEFLRTRKGVSTRLGDQIQMQILKVLT